MKIFGYIVLAIIGIALVSAVGIGLKIAFFPVKVGQNEVQTGYDAVDKVINADNAIYNYHWFKQQKEDIDALGRKYKNASDSYDSYVITITGEKTFEDKTEIARLNSVKVGIKNQLEQVIADYNARLAMADRVIFKDSILPSFIDATTFILKK